MTKLIVHIPDDNTAVVTTTAKGTSAYKEYISAMNKFTESVGTAIKNVDYPSFTLSSEYSDDSIVDYVQYILKECYSDAVTKDEVTNELSEITFTYTW